MTATTRSEERRTLAEKALGRLGGERSARELLVVQCAHSHHLAEVVDTDFGPVYVTRIGPHGHGRLDLPDLGRHGSRAGEEYADLLHDPLGGDDLPAWCDCGPRQLSRRWLAERLSTGAPTAHI